MKQTNISKRDSKFVYEVLFNYFYSEERCELLLLWNRIFVNNPDRYSPELSKWKAFATYETRNGGIASSHYFRPNIQISSRPKFVSGQIQLSRRAPSRPFPLFFLLLVRENFQLLTEICLKNMLFNQMRNFKNGHFSLQEISIIKRLIQHLKKNIC